MVQVSLDADPNVMGAEPKVSVSAIVPTYNRGAFIVRSIESILGQTLPPSEIIVVDDGSTDGTAEDLRSRYGDRLTIIQQANEGVSSARRKGLEAASGDWIAFLDSDDEWLPRHLEILANAASVADERVSLVFGDTVVVRDSGDGSTLFEEEGFSTSGPIQVFSEAFATQFPYMFTLLQSSLIRRTAMLETGAFLERLRSSEDFLVSFRLSLHSSFAAVPDRVTRIYRTSDLDASSLDRDKSQHEDYYRARMIAFGEAAALLGDRSWRVLYLRAASCLTRLRIKQGADAVPVALQQFRFGVTPRAVAWTIAAFARSIVAPPRPRSC